MINDFDSLIKQFVQSEQLPELYSDMARRWFLPLAKQLAVDIAQQKLKVLGIVGSQGSGKSTLASLLKVILEADAKNKNSSLKVVVLSLDDFYLTRDERTKLGAEVHPLLSTRGVPGTHDVKLAIATIDSLLNTSNSKNPDSVKIPRFDKARDDRVPKNEWEVIREPVDLIIFEGWCVSNLAQSEQELTKPINNLERLEDSEGVWRTYVNSCLSDQYSALWNKIDKLIMLQIPNFDLVYHWRQRQEDKLIEKIKGDEKNSDLKVMDRDSIKRFIQHFERLTRHNLNALPKIADIVFKLNEQQIIVDKFEKNDSATNWLVVTDLDGTLLDHFSYSHELADNTLAALETKGIPVIINTSKTFAELIELREELRNVHPFVVENGSAIYIPKGYFSSLSYRNNVAEIDDKTKVSSQDFDVICLGVERASIQAWLKKIKPSFPNQFKSFSDLGIEGIVAATGLPVEQAKLSNQRGYSEPLHWLGSETEKQVFINKAQDAGFGVLEGGRFLHILGNSDKGLATKRIKELYRINFEKSFSVVAAGDGKNDIAMLEAADVAVLVKSPVHKALKLCNGSSTKVIQTEEVGPLGWSEALDLFFGEAQIAAQAKDQAISKPK